MDQERIKQELKSVSEEIAEQVKIITGYKERIPRIEMDILMGNVRKLYEQLYQLSKKYDSAPVTNMETFIPEPEKEKVAVVEPQEIKIQEITTVRQEVFISAESVEPGPVLFKEETKTEKVEVIAEVIVKQEEPVVKAYSKKAVAAKSAASLFEDFETVGDKFEEQPTIHDKISKSKEEQSIIDKLNLTPVSDLKKAIGINEKFGFINDLFDGSLNDYSTVVDRLNSLGNFAEAEQVLNTDLAIKFNNKRDSRSYLEFYQLIRRRYLS